MDDRYVDEATVTGGHTRSTQKPRWTNKTMYFPTFTHRVWFITVCSPVIVRVLIVGYVLWGHPCTYPSMYAQTRCHT